MAELNEMKQGTVWKTRDGRVVKLVSEFREREGRIIPATVYVVEGEGKGTSIKVNPSALRIRTTLAARGLRIKKSLE